MKNFDADRIAEIVAKKLSRDFAKIEIVKVNVEQSVDHDGEEILLIQVVFKGELSKAAAQQIPSFARQLRPALVKEVVADLYPLLSFVSKVDYDRGHGKREAR